MPKVMDVISLGLNAKGSSGVYKDSREKGRGVTTSVGVAALDFAFYEVVSLPWLIGIQAAKGSVELAKVAHKMGYDNAQVSSKQYSANFGGHGRFNDSQVGATMRSRGLQAMQQSGVQGYSTLGNEARQYFR